MPVKLRRVDTANADRDDDGAVDGVDPVAAQEVRIDVPAATPPAAARQRHVQGPPAPRHGSGGGAAATPNPRAHPPVADTSPSTTDAASPTPTCVCPLLVDERKGGAAVAHGGGGTPRAPRAARAARAARVLLWSPGTRRGGVRPSPRVRAGLSAAPPVHLWGVAPIESFPTSAHVAPVGGAPTFPWGVPQDAHVAVQIAVGTPQNTGGRVATKGRVQAAIAKGRRRFLPPRDARVAATNPPRGGARGAHHPPDAPVARLGARRPQRVDRAG